MTSQTLVYFWCVEILQRLVIILGEIVHINGPGGAFEFHCVISQRCGLPNHRRENVKNIQDSLGITTEAG